jgi:hypothetical protein
MLLLDIFEWYIPKWNFQASTGDAELAETEHYASEAKRHWHE